MRAVVVDRYGPPEVARVAELPDPQPGPGQVLVRVVAAAVSSGDARMRAGRFPAGFALPARLAIGVRGPRRRVLGFALSGVVEAVGEGVDGLAPGDEVAGSTGGTGAHAELVVLPAAKLVPKPAGVPHEHAAAALFGGHTALHFLRDVAGVRAGQRVLVIGAAGAVGSSAVQVARLAGAHVTGVASAPNADLLRRLGADAVLDRATVDYDALEERYDVVLDAVGALSPARGRRLLTSDGMLILVVASLWQTILGQTIGGRGPVRTGVAPTGASTSSGCSGCSSAASSTRCCRRRCRWPRSRAPTRSSTPATRSATSWCCPAPERRGPRPRSRTAGLAGSCARVATSGIEWP